jgi:hypothetical protein
MVSTRRIVPGPFLLLGAIAPFFFTSAAWAQSYGTEAPPPPGDEDAAQPPVDALPPPQAPDESTFEQNLNPYGRWMDTPDYGRVWVPSNTSPDWQPYTDGHWVDTEWGWSFASSVPWGWATFHYGRWGFGSGLGWFWVPGFVWSPAWVSWRYYPGYVCWSPFAPGGFAFGGRWPGWVVLPGVHFTHPINNFRVPRTHTGVIVRAANPVASIASRTARAHFGGPGRSWGNGNVRGGGNVRAGTARPSGGTRPAHGLTRSTFRSAAPYRGSFNSSATRSFPARGIVHGSSFGGGRTFAAVTPGRSTLSRGFARRR